MNRVGIRIPMTNTVAMQDRLEVQSLKNIVGDDDRLAQFFSASLAVIERFSDQLERKDRSLDLKDERLRSLDHEIVQLRAAITKLQRSNDDARRSFNAAQLDRQRTIERLGDEIEVLRAKHEKSRALEDPNVRVVPRQKNLGIVRAGTPEELRDERDWLVRSNQAEIDRTRAQIAEVDAMIAAIQRSFFWRIKMRLAMLRSSVRAAVRR